MEELFGSLLGLGIVISLIILFIVYIVLPIVGIILTIMLAVAILTAMYASGHSFFIGIKNFYLTSIKAHQKAENRSLSEIQTKTIFPLYEPQPAFLIYFYEAGWFVMRYIAKNVWRDTNDAALEWFDKGKKWWNDAEFAGFVARTWAGSLAIGAFVGGSFHYATTVLIVGVFVAVQLLVLSIGVVLTSVTMLFLGIGNWIYGRYYQIYHRCPTCHYQMTIPVHVCDNCGKEHTRLWPSVYGILEHRCKGTDRIGATCNNLLPTLGFRGRDKLKQKCPECTSPLEGLGGTNIHFPIVGGPNVGKSHYIVMAMIELIEKYAPANKLEVSLPNSQHQREYQQNVRLVKSGQRLSKTSDADDSAKAFNVQIKPANQKVPKLLYIYDAAGEYFSSDERAEQQKYFKYVHGILWIIDPFAIDKVRTEYESKLQTTPGIVSPSTQSLDVVYETMLTSFETRAQLKRNQIFNQPIAVVLTKCDAFDLENRVGAKAASTYMRQHPEIKSEGEAIHCLVEKFLDEYAGNSLRNLRGQFKNVRFFSCSAIGNYSDLPNTTNFEGVRILAPLLWLIEQNKVLSGGPPILTQWSRFR
jgi:rRNA maturation endonuclease Nob1